MTLTHWICWGIGLITGGLVMWIYKQAHIDVLKTFYKGVIPWGHAPGDNEEI